MSGAVRARAGGRGVGLLLAVCALVSPTPAAAQDGEGFYLEGGLFLVRPYLDDTSGEVFDQIGFACDGIAKVIVPIVRTLPSLE